MEAEVIDSLWEVARQEQGWYQDLFLVARVVYQEGHRDIYRLGFGSLDQVISYFQTEELGDGVFDREDRVILFHYDHPTGPITYMYAFYRDETFNAVISALADRLEEAELDLGISRKVIDDHDPGIYPPFVGEITPEDIGLADVDIQDFTDADLRRENNLISPDLYGRPVDISKQRSKANGCGCRHQRKKTPISTVTTSQNLPLQTNTFNKANAYSSQDQSFPSYQTIQDQGSSILFNEFNHIMRPYPEIEPGGVAPPRSDLSLGVAELGSDPRHTSFVGRTFRRPLVERNLLNTSSLYS